MRIRFVRVAATVVAAGGRAGFAAGCRARRGGRLWFAQVASAAGAKTTPVRLALPAGAVPLVLGVTR